MKKKLIRDIQAIVEKWGPINISQSGYERVVYEYDGPSMIQYIERIGKDDVDVLVYMEQEEIDSFTVPLEDLYVIAQAYDVATDKLMDSCNEI